MGGLAGIGPAARMVAMETTRTARLDLWHDCGYIGPMAKTTTIRARIEPKLKAEAEAVLAKLGLTPSDAIRLLYHQVRLTKGLPFEIAIERTPNATTRRALRDSAKGKGVRRFADKDAFFRSLGL
jgi:DNA-damage-inducible protein J